MTVIKEKSHSKLSPSAAKRWLTCPGSVALIAALPEGRRTSKFAAEGTVAHEVGELCLRHDKEPSEYKGKTFTADGFKFKVTQEMIEAVEEYVDYVRDVIHDAEVQADEFVELQVEVKSSLTFLGIPGLDGGTSDTVLICRGHQFVEIADYKHGAGVAVDVINNSQARSYALGVIEKLGIKRGDDWQIINTIVQPRAHHKDGRIRSERMTSDELWDWCDDILVPGAKATREENAAIVPSDDGCRFCPIAGNCAGLYDATQQIAMLDFADVTDVVMPNPLLLTSDQKQFIMLHGAAIKSFIVAVEKQIKDEMDTGSKEYADELKLVRKSSNRKFTDDALDEVCSPLLDHLERSDLFVEKPRTMTEIEKRLKKAIGPKMAKDVMEDITDKPLGDIVVALQSDKRKEVEPTVMSDFTDID